MALTEKLTAIGDAIRGQTGGTDALTLDQMAAEIAAIETGSGAGSMESGELTLATANFYGFTIPVSTKKSYVVIFPKSIADALGGAHNTGRVSLIFAAEGNGHAEVRTSAGWIKTSENSIATFGDTSITFGTSAMAPYNTGDYCWYAW